MSGVVIMAASSGLLHIIMSNTQSPPPPPRPAAALDLTAVDGTSLTAVRTLVDGAPIQSCNLRMLDGRPCWQVLTAGATQARYADASNGAPLPEADGRLALEIARNYLGGASASLRLDGYLTSFDREYIGIFRLLPVHRVRVDDGQGTRLYVSTLAGSVARHTDNARQREATLFSLLHKWQFIPHRGLRDSLLSLAMVGLLTLAMGGLWLFWRSRPQRT
jgi:hypothetical protein